MKLFVIDTDSVELCITVTIVDHRGNILNSLAQSNFGVPIIAQESVFQRITEANGFMNESNAIYNSIA